MRVGLRKALRYLSRRTSVILVALLFGLVLLRSSTSFLALPEGEDLLYSKPAYNIVLVKVPKTGGSTLAGCLRRVAHFKNLSNVFRGYEWIEKEPGIWACHGPFTDLSANIRKLRLPRMLVTMVRHPVERCLSEYYHLDLSRRISRGKATGPTISEKLKLLRSDPRCHDAQYNYLCADSESAEECFAKYDFVGTTERFDESMMLLRAVMGVPAEQLWYIPSKVSGHRDDRGMQIVAHPPVHNEPPEVQAFANSSEWAALNARDTRIFQLASNQLDALALRYGPDRLKHDVHTYQASLRSMQQRCGSYANKKTQACYWNDHGCGYKCMDQLVRETNDERMK